jgi:helicase-like protein
VRGDTIQYIYTDSKHNNLLCRVTPIDSVKSLPPYDNEKYKEMILDAAETVLGFFGFNRGKLSLNSIREMPKYPEPYTEHVNVNVDATKTKLNIKRLKRNPLLIEQLILPEKLPEIIKHIDGQTVIYTHYVEGIVSEILKAVRVKGHSCAEYTGDDHTGLDLFLEKQVQVLVGSSPIATGVNRLQDVCHNLIISALPWTNAQYQQLIGRIVRLGQKNDSAAAV